MSRHRIAIVTDSSAYIPAGALEGLDVTVIPLWLIWDSDHFRDDVDIDSPTFYRRLSQSDTLPTSSQPSVGEFAALFRDVATEADSIVSVLVSSQISGTVASALGARGELPGLRIEVVDSLSCSMGLGFVVLAAARAAAAGGSVEEVVHAAEDMRDRVHTIFVVDTLEYLHRGGRISGVKRAMGTALRIKPLLHFHEGRIEPLAQARTKRKALNKLLDIAEERLAGRAMAEAAVMDVDDAQSGDAVAEMVRARFGPPTVLRTGVCPVVGTHVGPGTVGLAFYAAE